MTHRAGGTYLLPVLWPIGLGLKDEIADAEHVCVAMHCAVLPPQAKYMFNIPKRWQISVYVTHMCMIY